MIVYVLPDELKNEAALVLWSVRSLWVRGIPAWRNQSGKIRTFRGGQINMGVKGASDIIGCLPPNGRLLAAEAKFGAARTTPEQDRFLKVIEDAGGVAFVFRSIEELNRKLDSVKEFVTWETSRKKSKKASETGRKSV